MANLTKKQRRALKDAAEKLHKNDAPYKRAANGDFMLYLITVVLIALFVRTFIFEPVQVVGSSMHPTLIDGEGMFTEKLTYTFSEPKHGDIIICRYSNLTVNCVKRIIGMPGDTVAITDGKMYLNGNQLDESAYWNDIIYGDMDEVTVPEKCLFVVGDNRNGSDDSRNPYVGFVPYGQVKGKVQAVMSPFFRARWM
ncbi:MAG: signal peptidase I [Clostridia bacterium]|nr:signal peptidase I [Clostridia bacterium]